MSYKDDQYTLETIISYIKSRCSNLTDEEIIVLIWLYDRIHLNLYGIFGLNPYFTKYKKWVFGVFSDVIYDTLNSEYGFYPDIISESNSEALDIVINNFAKLDYDILLSLVEYFPEYYKECKLIKHDSLEMDIFKFLEEPKENPYYTKEYATKNLTLTKEILQDYLNHAYEKYN